MHVRRTLTKKEVKEYEDWKSKHDAAIKNNQLTKKQKEEKRRSFWSKESALINDRLAMRGDHRSIPSLPPQKVIDVKRNPLLDVDPDHREEYLRRERLAQQEMEEKKSRVGPTYNKGGNQYWTEEMLKDLKGGGHRRR